MPSPIPLEAPVIRTILATVISVLDVGWREWIFWSVTGIRERLDLMVSRN